MKLYMRPRTPILGAVLVAAAILGVFAVVRQCSESRQFMRPEEFMAFIQNADRVELAFDNFFMAEDRKAAMVNLDAEEARQLVSGLELDHKDPCECAHIQGLIFWQGDRKLKAAICDHCFDVITGDGRDMRAHRYQMPPAFYARFRELESQYRSPHQPEAEPAD